VVGGRTGASGAALVPDGSNVGADVLDGTIVGASVGGFVSPALLGAAVARPAGSSVGEAVGDSDESSEGAFEDGTALGSMVGSAVGSGVGSAVGASVGSAVGEAVMHRRWIVSTAERSIGDREAMAGRTHLEYRALYSFLHVAEQLAAEAADDPPVAHAEMSICASSVPLAEQRTRAALTDERPATSDVHRSLMDCNLPRTSAVKTALALRYRLMHRSYFASYRALHSSEQPAPVSPQICSSAVTSD